MTKLLFIAGLLGIVVVTVEATVESLHSGRAVPLLPSELQGICGAYIPYEPPGPDCYDWNPRDCHWVPVEDCLQTEVCNLNFTTLEWECPTKKESWLEPFVTSVEDSSPSGYFSSVLSHMHQCAKCEYCVCDVGPDFPLVIDPVCQLPALPGRWNCYGTIGVYVGDGPYACPL